MSKKLLKNVDWIIPVPDKDDLKDALIYSTQFSIERNGIITKWKLMQNFNGGDKRSLSYLFSDQHQHRHYFEAYLKPISENKLKFDLEIVFIVLNWIYSEQSMCGIVNSVKRLCNEEKESEVFGTKLIAHEKLFAEENNYIKDGKLNLIVVIYEGHSRENRDENSLESSNLIEKSQFDEVFKTMTSDDRDEITLQTADGVNLKALKQIIAKKSPVFAAMIETEMVEKSQGFVEIIDFSGKIMTELLRFMYVGKINSIEDVDMMELYNAAKVYQVEGLAKICVMSIKSRINLSNVFKIVEFAHVHDETDLFETCCDGRVCRFYAADSFKQKMKELPDKIQIRVLTYLVTYLVNVSNNSRGNRIFCEVEAE